MNNTTYKIAVIVGSLRKESYNRKVAQNLIKLAPSTLALEIIEIGDLPFYSEDLDNDTPPATWSRFREQIKGVDGVLFLTPEYNRSYSAVIKNAIDVGSRPYGQNAWDGKPAGVIGVSIGAMAAFGANQHLRQTLSFLNMPSMQQPEAYIGNIANLLEENGDFKARTKEFMQKYINAFAAWVEKINH